MPVFASAAVPRLATLPSLACADACLLLFVVVPPRTAIASGSCPAPWAGDRQCQSRPVSLEKAKGKNKYNKDKEDG